MSFYVSSVLWVLVIISYCGYIPVSFMKTGGSVKTAPWHGIYSVWIETDNCKVSLLELIKNCKRMSQEIVISAGDCKISCSCLLFKIERYISAFKPTNFQTCSLNYLNHIFDGFLRRKRKRKLHYGLFFGGFLPRSIRVLLLV